uniref:Uncharacterized protein n=1 Tax=Rhizophora mucronata TaxID=61149 RepID=A0A2P2QCU7_RHIMU
MRYPLLRSTNIDFRDREEELIILQGYNAIKGWCVSCMFMKLKHCHFCNKSIFIV